MPDFDYDAIVPYAVVRAGQRLERFFQALMAQEHLTPRQFGILAQFAAAQAVTAADIARNLEVKPQSVSPQIDLLVEKGLLTRTPMPGRGRPIEVRLTDEGQALTRKILGMAVDAQERLTGHMSEKQRRTMLDQLEEIGRRADAEAH